MVERDLTAHENLDQVDRYRWSKACAYALIKGVEPVTLLDIATSGFPKFLSTATEQYARHCFQLEDFQRIFQWILEAAGRLPASVHRDYELAIRLSTDPKVVLH